MSHTVIYLTAPDQISRHFYNVCLCVCVCVCVCAGNTVMVNLGAGNSLEMSNDIEISHMSPGLIR